MSRFLPVHTMNDLEGLIRYTGILPFFTCSIPGFSVEENCAPEIWFSENSDGPWEWKGPMLRSREIFYGKFAENKAVFCHRDLFPALLNYRRNGYDFSTRWELGIASRKEHAVMETLHGEGILLSPDLKKRAGFGKGGFSGYDQVSAALQMQGYICVEDFTYRVSKTTGERYGWGVARLTEPETLLDAELIEQAYEDDPQDSLNRIIDRVCTVMPDVSREAAAHWLR